MKGATVLGVIQCVRDKDSEAGLFSLKEEEWLVDFTHQVAMQVVNPTSVTVLVYAALSY